MAATPKLLLKSLLNQKVYLTGEAVIQLESKLASFFDSNVFVVNSGRSAIYLSLKALGIGYGDEVLLQAYTCNAVPNPILWTGAVPIFVDIDENSLNLDIADLRKKITPKSKAIIVQHTFGNPAKIREILKIAEEHHLKVIEDCAHSLGGRIDNKLLGTFGDLAILSFGREKIISSLSGGAIVVNDSALIDKVKDEISSLKTLPKKKIFQEINNYFSWRVLFRRFLNNGWGVGLIRYLYQFDSFNVITSQKELSGLKPDWYPTKMPDLFAKLALQELEKIEIYNQERQQVALEYFQRLQGSKLKLIGPHSGVYLRVVGISPKAESILAEAKKRKLAFGNWYNTVVYPEGVHLARLGYKSGSCPVAEKLAPQTINLPNYIGIPHNEIERVVVLVRSFD